MIGEAFCVDGFFAKTFLCIVHVRRCPDEAIPPAKCRPYSGLLVLHVAVIALCGCKSDYTPTASHCIQYCPSNWSGDNATTCPGTLNDDQRNFLNDANVCPAGAAFPVWSYNYWLNHRAPPNPPSSNVSAPSSGWPQTLRPVNFRLTKFDLTASAENAAWAAEIKKEFGNVGSLSSFDVERANLSYQPILTYAKGLVSKNHTVLTAVQRNGYIASQFVNYSDSWGQEVIKKNDLCGDPVAVRTVGVVNHTANATTGSESWWVSYSWADDALMTSVAAKAYEKTYAKGAKSAFNVLVYLFDARIGLMEKDEDGCRYRLVSENEMAGLATMTGQNETELSQQGATSITNYLDVKGDVPVHSAIVEIYAPGRVEGKDHCSSNKEHFARVLSHELGHFLINAAHDKMDDVNHLMYPVTRCPDPGKGYVLPFRSDVSSSSDDVLQPDKSPDGQTEFSQSTNKLGSMRWIP